MTDNQIDMLGPLIEAVECAGGQAALASKVNEVQLPMPAVEPKTRGHVSTWKRRGACPPNMVLRIEAVTGISRHQLRPDVFGHEPISYPATAAREAAE
ncbi:MAG TPA: YdaS family helix-turn-helix protein [Devosiaceae bacterium]|jgi:DNA-binding transcriptional regulator YdaS (Cro superfamily)|nr:YdaS family helix-turn-helix protein [Devosiaceae bacterium]